MQKMPNFVYSTAEDFKGTRFGTRILELVQVLALPIPTIQGLQLRKFQRKDLWGFRVTQPGRETEPQTGEITFKVLHDDMERGLDVAMQELLGRLCGRHSSEIKSHYFHFFGRRDEDGEPIVLDKATKESIKPVRHYLQDLESLIRHLDTDRTNVMLSNDELRVQLKEKDKAFQEQENRIKEMEKKFEDQEKKFKSQEKRVQEKNKKIRDLETELELENIELEADHEVIERLRTQKRELQTKIDALTTSLEEYKAGFASAGLALVEEEVDMEE
jgi:hypothetical protein